MIKYLKRRPEKMKIKWLGLGCYLITSDNGTRIITDPFLVDENIPFEKVTEHADVITISHGHGAHSYVFNIGGIPQIYSGTAPTEIRGIKFKGVMTRHSGYKGEVIIICIEVDGIRICHCGDLGQRLSDPQIERIGEVDIFLSMLHSSDETHSIQDACDLAAEIGNQLNPKVIIPMQRFVVDDLDEFINGKENVTLLDTNEMEFHKESLPSVTQIIAFKVPLKQNK